MNPELTLAQKTLHLRAVACGRDHRGAEANLVLVLQDVERSGLWRKFDRRSLFAYAVGELGLTNSVAGMSIAVARTAMLFPLLQNAIEKRQMSVSLASRIVSCLTPENSGDVIAYALTHTCREVNEDCARRNPQRDARDGAKPTADKRIKLTVTVSRAIYDKLRRVESLEAQCNRAGGLERAIEAASEEYLARRDPVRKAARAQAKASGKAAASPEPCTYRDKQNNTTYDPVGSETDSSEPTRLPMTAAQRHAVHFRDGGMCTHVGASGKRCGADRWIDVHHVRPVAQGGGNEPGNLTTLCSRHHDLVHQTSFPIDGQVSWIREREVTYRSDLK